MDLTTADTEALLARERELFPLVNRAGAAKQDITEYHAIEDELAGREDHDPAATMYSCHLGSIEEEIEAQQYEP